MLVVIGMAITYLSRLSETAELAIRENQREEGGQS
jgi:hypothetical protein